MSYGNRMLSMYHMLHSLSIQYMYRYPHLYSQCQRVVELQHGSWMVIIMGWLTVSAILHQGQILMCRAALPIPIYLPIYAKTCMLDCCRGNIFIDFQQCRKSYGGGLCIGQVGIYEVCVGKSATAVMLLLQVLFAICRCSRLRCHVCDIYLTCRAMK